MIFGMLLGDELQGFISKPSYPIHFILDEQTCINSYFQGISLLPKPFGYNQFFGATAVVVETIARLHT